MHAINSLQHCMEILTFNDSIVRLLLLFKRCLFLQLLLHEWCFLPATEHEWYYVDGMLVPQSEKPTPMIHLLLERTNNQHLILDGYRLCSKI